MNRTKNWIFISLVLNRFVKCTKLLHAREISTECSLPLCVPKRDNNSGGSAVPFRTNGISHRPEIIHREIVPRGHRCLLSKIELSRQCSYSTYIYIYNYYYKLNDYCLSYRDSFYLILHKRSLNLDSSREKRIFNLWNKKFLILRSFIKDWDK